MFMRRNKEKIYQVEIKPRLNFMGKFYITCIILFVLFVAYILIYREIHRDEIIENVKNNNRQQVIVQNTTEENI